MSNNMVKSEMSKILKKANEIANKIAKGESRSADCIIIESTNPYYNEISKILKKRKKK